MRGNKGESITEKKDYSKLAEDLVKRSIQQNTTKRYNSQFMEWCNFTEEHSDIIQNGSGPYLDGCSEHDKQKMALSFMAYLFYEKGSRAATINNYMSAIRTELVFAGQNVAFLDAEKTKRFKRAAQLDEGARGIQQDKKKPIPLKLVMEMVNSTLDKNKMMDKPYRVAILMAYFFLLRQSEYIYSPRANDHAIRVSDVEFRMNNGVFIQSHLLRTSGFSVEQIDLIKVTLRHCKNDPYRQGNFFWVNRKRSKNGSMDLVQELAEFAWGAHSKEGDVFTSCRFPNENGKMIRVTYKRVMDLLRETAVRHGLESKLFGTHSFRIGGATALDSGRIDQKTIQQLGGWRSECTHMQYAQPSAGRFTAAHEVLLNEDSFTLQDLQLHIRTKQCRKEQRVKLTGGVQEITEGTSLPKFAYEEDLIDEMEGE